MSKFKVKTMQTSQPRLTSIDTDKAKKPQSDHLHVKKTNTALAANYQQIVEIGISLSSERNYSVLIEKILLGLKSIMHADGGTLYLVDQTEQQLDFKILVNDSLNLKFGGIGGKAHNLKPVLLFKEDGSPNLHNVASSVYHECEISVIDDAYEDKKHDFSGTKEFDKNTGYLSKSFLTIPMVNSKDEIIAIIQLINALDDEGQTIAFDAGLLPVIRSLTSQAAIALDNQNLLAAQRNLWDSLIELLATSIDNKSPYTGGHCQRVPVLTKMIAQSACEADYGIFKDFNLDDDEWYELHVAAWLHDCGKITTPEFIVDKASKLETIYNRIHEIRTRFEVLYRDAEIDCLKRQLAGENQTKCEADLQTRLNELKEQFSVVAQANIGGEVLSDETIENIQQIGKQAWVRHFDDRLGLSPLETHQMQNIPTTKLPHQESLLADLPQHKRGDYNHGELYNLSIRRGTLTAEERETINDHIVVTIQMLESLPFPKGMSRVSEYAGGHHERMDGLGYPSGLTGDQMSIPARIMAVADIFEALTAADRPYKPSKTLNESLAIMTHMAKTGHIDPDIYNLFLESKVWLHYAEQHLRQNQIDKIDFKNFLV